MAELLYRIGRGSARRAWTVIVTWIAVLAAAGAAFALGGGTLATSFSIPGTPTAETTDRLEEELPDAAGSAGTVVFTSDDEFTAEQRDAIADLVEKAEDVDGVETAIDPFATEEERADQLAELEDGEKQIAEGRDEIADGREQIDAGLDELDQAQEELDAAREQAEAAGMLEQQKPQLDAQQAELDAGREELEAQSDELESNARELEEEAERVENGKSLLDMASDMRMVSEDGDTALVTLSFTEGDGMMIPQETSDAVMKAFDDEPIAGVQVDYSTEIAGEVPEIFGVGEAIGLVVAAIVLIVMLGTLIGAGLPILNALIGVGIGGLAAMSLSGVVEMASVTPILGIMLGLAVGIDYSLFILNRHRRQLKDGYDVTESIAMANGTSGNAVVFAGATVAIALLALNVTGIPFLGLMGNVAAMCIAIAVLVAVTLTPALLALAGPRILGRRERAAINGSAPETADIKPRSTWRALAAVAACVVGLLAVAIPALDLRLNLPDGSSEASDSTQYQAFHTIADEFGAGQNGSLLVVADLSGEPSDDEATEQQVAIAESIYDHDDVTAVAPAATSEDNTVAAFQVIPADGPTSESTEQLVHDLRDSSPIDGEYPVEVAGSASGNIDISEKLADALPIYLAVVVGLSLLILMMVFRSLYVPIIATAGFVLSSFAALGGVVAIYQWGWLASVFGVDSPGPVLNFLPTLLVGILFGLAMDYMLFLGTGMREAYVHGAKARIAVVQGFRAGRAVVTAAAIIMISVFGGFVFSHSAMIRPIGFALAFGVLVDAFVVRMTLIPALMHLAGEKAWWLPKWLDRILPDVDVEGAALERRHPHSEDAEEKEKAAASTG